MNGVYTHPVFRFLKQFYPGDIKQYFEMFLLDKNGLPVNRFSASTPMAAVEQAVRELLCLQ